MKYKGDENTREFILRLAVEAIDRGGEAAVKAKEICRTADVAVTSLYHYFGSRDGLIVAAQARRYVQSLEDLNTWWGSAVRSAKSQDEFKAIVAQLKENIFSPKRARGRAIRMNVIGSAYARPDLMAAVAAEQERVLVDSTEILEFAQTKGWILASLDCRTAAAWHFMNVSGYSILEIEGSTVDATALADMYYRAICWTFFGE